MISEAEARRLLAAGAETVRVSPTTPSGLSPGDGRPRRTGWIAAAAALAVIGGGALLAQQLGSEDGTRPVSPSSTVPADGAVPPVFGHTAESIGPVLVAEGFDVSYETAYDCLYAEGRVLGTDPAPGSVPEDGKVRVSVSGGMPPNALCSSTVTEEQWALLDLAAGRTGEVRFARDVQLVLDGGAPVAVTGSTLADPAAWARKPALRPVGTAMRALLPQEDGTFAGPQLGQRTGLPPARECGIARPAAVTGPDTRVVTLFLGPEGGTCPTALDVVYRGTAETGAIRAIVVRTAQPDQAAPARAVPDVVGLAPNDAAEVLADAGFAVDTQTWERCGPGAGITEQRPRAGQRRPAGSAVTVTVEREPDGVNCAGLANAAEAFAAWARDGGPAPRFADDVTLMVGYARAAVLTGAERSLRNAWSVALAPELSATWSAVERLDAHRGDVAARWFDGDLPAYDDPELSNCGLDFGALPRAFARADAQPITLQPAVPGDRCEEIWSVSIWVDDDGAITGVNLR